MFIPIPDSHNSVLLTHKLISPKMSAFRSDTELFFSSLSLPILDKDGFCLERRGVVRLQSCWGGMMLRIATSALFSDEGNCDCKAFGKKFKVCPPLFYRWTTYWEAIGSNGYLNIGRSLVLHELSICSVRQKGAPLARLTAFILFLGSLRLLPYSRKGNTTSFLILTTWNLGPDGLPRITWIKGLSFCGRISS